MKKMNCVIYHIPGVKVGCTTNLTRRIKSYDPGVDIHVLEQLEDVTAKEAGDREHYWAEKYGYRKGYHYSTSAGGHTLEEQTEYASLAGAANVKNKKGIHALSSKEKSELQKPHVVRASLLGLKNGANNLKTYDSDIQRERGKKGFRTQWELGLNPIMNLSPEQKKKGLRTAGTRGGVHIRASCIYCMIESNISILTRWHFDNCKKRPK